MKTYTKKEVIAEVKAKLIEVYGKITPTGYVILGVIQDTLKEN